VIPWQTKIDKWLALIDCLQLFAQSADTNTIITTVYTVHPGYLNPEPVFVSLLRNPGIDSQPYLTYRPARLHWPAESIPRNPETLQIRAQREKRAAMWRGKIDISGHIGWAEGGGGIVLHEARISIKKVCMVPVRFLLPALETQVTSTAERVQWQSITYQYAPKHLFSDEAFLG